MPFRFLCRLRAAALALALALPLALTLTASAALAQEPRLDLAGGVQGPRLDLDTALALAAERAPLLRASEAAARSARELAVAAGQRPDPVLRFGITNLPIDGPDAFSTTRDFMTMRSIGAMQEFTRAGKLRSRAASHAADADAALAQRDERLAALRHETALAWLERHGLERLRELLLQQRDEARLQIDAAEAAYRGGRGTQADALSARAQAAALDDRVAGVDARLEQAHVALERWVGSSDVARAPLGPRPDVSRLAQATLDTRLDELPQLIAHERGIAKAEAEVAVARAERNHDWSAELMFNQRGSQYSNMVSLTLSVPLPTDRAQRQERDVAARLADVERLRAERDEALREQRARIAGWQRDWHSAVERGRRHDEQLIPLAAARTQAALAAYRAGGGTLAGVLEARRAEIDARIERLQLDIEAARAWARLAHLFVSHGATR